MGPADWVTQRDLDLKKEAYSKFMHTHHWPSHGVRLFHPDDPVVPEKRPLTEQPEVARSLVARQLAGVEPYPPLQKGEVAVPLPKWREGYGVEIKDFMYMDAERK
jgi:hypothetical protein